MKINGHGLVPQIVKKDDFISHVECQQEAYVFDRLADPPWYR
jgi:hypothetical protein